MDYPNYVTTKAHPALKEDLTIKWILDSYFLMLPEENEKKFGIPVSEELINIWFDKKYIKKTK